MCSQYHFFILIFILEMIMSSLAWADVDARGNYVNQVPIEVPEFHSITPVVALGYHSGSGGLLGAGWDLQAGSIITRSSSTNGIPQFAADDLFFLDGEELVPCAANSTSPSCTTATSVFGTSNGFYSTRIESFERIRFDSGTWTVWGRDGTRRLYDSADSGVSYQLRYVTDTHGNQVDYSWACAAPNIGPCYIDSITYGANGPHPGAEIRFYREHRPDPRTIATGHGQIWASERLRSIVVRHRGQLVRAYGLKYERSKVSGASILTSIQHYGQDASIDGEGKVTAGATALLPPMTLTSDSLAVGATWQLVAENTNPGVFDVGAAPAVSPVYARPRPPNLPSTYLKAEVGEWLPKNSSETFKRPNGTIIGDFDGDGRAEVLAWGLDGACANVSLMGQLNTASGPGSQIAAKIPTGISAGNRLCTANVMSADIDGDSRDDMVAMLSHTNPMNNKPRTQLVVALGQPAGGFIPNSMYGEDQEDFGCNVVDADGDSRDDLVCGDSSAKLMRTYLARPGAWNITQTPTDGTAGLSLPNLDKLQISAGDVDGDGLGDVILAQPTPAGSSTRIIFGRSKGDGSYYWSEEQTFAADIQKASFSGFHLTDIDGDGRLDLAFTKQIARAGGGIGTKITYALARKGYVGARWQEQPPLETELLHVQFADLDGDGRADLFTKEGPTSAGYEIRTQLANSSGGLMPVDRSRKAVCVSDPNANGSDYLSLTAADFNGDGLADPLCISNFGSEFILVDQASESRGTDRHRWQRADLDGDGRLEWAYIQFTNPGYKIHVVSPVTQTRTTFTLWANFSVQTPDPQIPKTGPLTEPDASRWIFADVGSPAGPADGKQDLVLIENSGGTLHLTTLYATGVGVFDVHYKAAWSPYLDSSTRGWFAAQLDRDARAELVRLRPDSGDGVEVDILRPVGLNQWSTDSRAYFAGSAVRSTGRFMPTDVNGDRLTDLVHIDASSGANATIRTLRANGRDDFTFTELVSTIPAASVDSRHWRLGDLDGDGAPDLVHVARTIGTSAPCLTISQLAGDGLGGFAPGNNGGSPCLSPANRSNPLYTRLFEDSSNVVLIDLDGDGADEIVHTTHAQDASDASRLIITRLKRDPVAPPEKWSATPEVIQLAYDHGDAWAWTGHRDSATGAAGLAYLHSQVASRLDWSGPSDELVSINNGIGLTTRIIYGPYLNSRAYLPAGYIPRIVNRVEMRNGVHGTKEPDVVDSIEYAYNDARWSDREGRLAGFGAMVISDARARLYRRFSYDDACGAHLTRVETRDASGAKIWSSTDFQALATGSAPPYRCLTEVAERNECELGSSCRLAERVEKHYDGLGNVDVERTDLDQATAFAVYTPAVPPNLSAYIVDRVAARATIVTPTSGLEMNVDRLGMDYRWVELPSADPLLCQSECVGDAACKSFTYVKPGLHAPGAVCYLKNGEPSPTPNNCCISGLRPIVTPTSGLEMDVDRLGMDYRWVGLPTADPLLCQSECAGDAACKSFTYVKPGLHAPGAVCYLKNGEPTPAPNNCCISGLRPRGMVPLGPQIITMRTFRYDHQQADNQPPLALGELTMVREWDDQLGSYTDSRNFLETSYSYAPNGVLTQVVSPGGKTTTTTLDSTYHRFPEQLCDDLHCTTQEWDFGLGKVKSLTDFSGGTRKTSYDAYGRITQVDNPDGGFTRNRYLNTGNTKAGFASRQRIRTEVSDGSASDGVLWSEDYFDGYGRTYRTSREGGATVTSIYLDSTDRPQAVSLVHKSTVKPSRWTRFEYDGLGRTTAVIRPDNTTIETHYSVGQVEQRDELKTTTVRKLDGAGKVIGLVEPTGATTAYEYNALGRLIKITDALGNLSTFSWTSLGRLKESTDPDRGLRTFKYFADGELSEQTDAKGQHIFWKYDVIGRAEQREDQNAAGVKTRMINWTYDEKINPLPHDASLGRLVRIEDTQSKTAYTQEFWYDKAGRVTQDRTCINGTCMDQGAQYDLAGRLATYIYPDAEQLYYYYNSAGYLYRVGSYAKLNWELDGLPSQIYYYNGVSSKFFYNPDRRWLDRLEISSRKNGNLQQFQYPQHDLAGRITNHTATGIQNGELAYSYDVLGRLKSVQSNDSSRIEEFHYDDIGRLKYTTALGDVKYQDPAHIHAATHSDLLPIQRSYDANGNVVNLNDSNGRDLALQWTVDDHVEQIKDKTRGEDWRFGYDPSGRRVEKEGPNGSWRSYGPRVAMDEKGKLVKYYFAGDQLLARNDGSRTYLHSDIARAVRLVTDNGGNLVADYQYSAFGQPVAGKSPLENEFGYSGARRDDALGLVAMGARIYDPLLGQFISADSIIPDAYRPQSLNRYRYVENDPINHWDPSGHMKASVELKKAREAESSFAPSEWDWKNCNNPFVECRRGGASYWWEVRRYRYFDPGPPISSIHIGTIVHTGLDDNEPNDSSDDKDLTPPPLVTADGTVFMNDPLPEPWIFDKFNKLLAFFVGVDKLGSNVVMNNGWGFQMGLGADYCFILCLGAGDVHVGVYFPPLFIDGKPNLHNFDPTFFVNGGAAALGLTFAPPQNMSTSDGYYQGYQLSPGMAYSIGADFGFFESQSLSFDDFSGYSLSLSGSAGNAATSLSHGLTNNYTLYTGKSISPGGNDFSIGGVAQYSTYTYKIFSSKGN
jgi:RHS repeat-associated protein